MMSSSKKKVQMAMTTKRKRYFMVVSGEKPLKDCLSCLPWLLTSYIALVNPRGMSFFL